MTNQNRISDYDLLANSAQYIRSEFDEHYVAWNTSPFRWILNIPSASKGKLGKRLIAQWCALKGLAVNSSPDSDADLLINGHRVEIKFSTLWKTHIYKFQQIRNQNYELMVCLGISPNTAHCWVIPKDVLLINVIGHMGQHGGRKARDTDWLGFKPNTPPKWLLPFGGTMEEAFLQLRRITPSN
jgi:hypothetical protein